jgi:calcium-dependent protein kinase
MAEPSAGFTITSGDFVHE